jgi:hypothetical protein
MMKKTLSQAILALCALALVLAAPAAGAGQVQETESTVPELSAYHDVIYPIWHTAYPEKDYAALRSYAPEVKGGAEKIYAAKLPGILHDRQAKWDQGVAELKKNVDAYLAAAAGTDDAALLAAAETLHSRYEILVRIIRPVLKEVDAFHKVLYVVYHTYLPDKDFARIKEVSPDLAAKAEAITKASLPKRLDSKAEAFQKAAADLHEASMALAASPDASMAAAVETLHTKYQALEKVFE